MLFICFYSDNFPQKTRRKICNTGKPNSICSESRQRCSRIFCVTIYLEYNTAEGKTKILTCLRLAQALLLPPGVNEFVQIHHPLHHPKAYLCCELFRLHKYTIKLPYFYEKQPCNTLCRLYFSHRLPLSLSGKERIINLNQRKS